MASGGGRRTIAATTGRAECRAQTLGQPQPDQVLDGRPHDVRMEAGFPGDVRRHTVSGLDGTQNARERTRRGGSAVRLPASRAHLAAAAHVSNLPIWKMATARAQAVTSWMAIPVKVHLVPISRCCADKVATHGV